MDRSRQMPNSTEQPSSSDDLIAELARLMAEEAQGDRAGARPAAPAVTPQAKPAPTAGQGLRSPESGNIVRIPGARPAPMASAPAVSSAAPAHSVWGRAVETPPAANSDLRVEPAPLQTTPEPASFSATPHAARPVETRPVLSDLISTDDDAFFAALNRGPATDDDTLIDNALSHAAVHAPAVAAPRRPDALAAAPADDPIAVLIAEQEREEFERARTHATQLRTPVEQRKPPVVATPAPTPKAPPYQTATLQPRHEVPVARQESPVLRQERQAPTPRVDAAVPEAKASVEPDMEDDVLSLLRAMNASRQAAHAPVKTIDNFATPPVFGLGSGNASDAGRPADPLDDIENLIGDAVRYSRDDRSAASLSAPEPSLDDAAHAAEAAIAAAAAESGRSGRVPSRREPMPADFHEPRPAAALRVTENFGVTPEVAAPAVKPIRRPNSRLIVGAAAAATILVAVALGLYWMFGESGEPNGVVPVLSSNTADAKVSPEQNTTSAQTTQPAIFNELDGKTAEAPVDEQIVSRDQSTEVAPAVRQVATPETADESLANRKVRTVTVRPDGSIVSSEDTVAANEVLPVERPDVPALSTDTGAATDFQVTTVPQVLDAQTAAATGTGTGTETPADPLASIVNSAVADQGTAPVGGEIVDNAPYPASRPADTAFVVAAATPVAVETPATNRPALAASTNTNTIDLIAGTANQVASQLPTVTRVTPPATPVAAPQEPAATAASAAPAAAGGAAFVQLSSQRSVDAANATLASVRQRYSRLFNTDEAFVKQVDLGDRGIYYRVLVPASSLTDAAGVCASVKSAGGDCFVRAD